jgi:hypothetical protein
MPSFKVPPASEFHLPRLGSGSSKVGGGVIAAIGAAIAGAFRAIFGLRRKNDGEA